MRHLACPTEAFSELKQLSGEAGLTNGYCCLEGCVHARVGIALPFWWWWWWSWFSCSVTSDSATPWTVATRLLCLWGLVMRKHRLRELISYPLSDSSGKVLVFCVDGGGVFGGHGWRRWRGLGVRTPVCLHGCSLLLSTLLSPQSAAAAPSPVLGNIPPNDGMPGGPIPPGFFQVRARPSALCSFPSRPGPRQAGGRERERSQ